MPHLSPTRQLKNRILLLESRRTAEWNLLKAQFKFTAESLKPANIMRSFLRGSAESPGLLERTAEYILAVVSGIIVKRIIAGDSKNIFKKIAGFIVQYFVTRAVSENADHIKSAGPQRVNGAFVRSRSSD